MERTQRLLPSGRTDPFHSFRDDPSNLTGKVPMKPAVSVCVIALEPDIPNQTTKIPITSCLPRRKGENLKVTRRPPPLVSPGRSPSGSPHRGLAVFKFKPQATSRDDW